MNIEASLRERILILDGAMGTKIQSLGLTAESYHQGALKEWPVSLVGNNDVLCLTAPEVIRTIHEQYIEAGADIIATNTFSANRISQKEYGLEEQAREMALAGARIARQAADHALTTHLSPLTSKRPMRTIDLIVIHCSATRCDRRFSLEDLIACHDARTKKIPAFRLGFALQDGLEPTTP